MRLRVYNTDDLRFLSEPTLVRMIEMRFGFDLSLISLSQPHLVRTYLRKQAIQQVQRLTSSFIERELCMETAQSAASEAMA